MKTKKLSVLLLVLAGSTPVTLLAAGPDPTTPDERECRREVLSCLIASNFSAQIDVTLCESEIINEGDETQCVLNAAESKRQRDEKCPERCSQGLPSELQF